MITSCRRRSSALARTTFLPLVVASLCAFAGSVPRVSAAQNRNSTALLVLPGFGYGRPGEQALRALEPAMNRAGVDLYIADYLTRGGLASSRARLERFIQDKRLDHYQRLYIFAFIAGAWTVNPLIEQRELPNLAGIVYDRSPFQERAPAVAADQLRVLAWLRFGSTIFDLARTPYTPIDAPGVNVGLLVESTPTAFVKKHETEVRAYGPVTFGCEGLNQRYDDCAYLALNHDDLYVRFADVWPELLAFIRTGRFTNTIDRTPPVGDPLSDGKRR